MREVCSLIVAGCILSICGDIPVALPRARVHTALGPCKYENDLLLHVPSQLICTLVLCTSAYIHNCSNGPPEDTLNRNNPTYSMELLAFFGLGYGSTTRVGVEDPDRQQGQGFVIDAR